MRFGVAALLLFICSCAAIDLTPIKQRADGHFLVPATNARPAFRAVVTNRWPEWLVPLFLVEQDGTNELRRAPMRGMESASEPLFFALPNDDETNSARFCGRWSVDATIADGPKHSFEWELAIQRERVIGRFVPDSEYRVAFINSGTIQSNRIELNVEHNDRYVVIGTLNGRRLSGTFQQQGGMERGTWSAEPAVRVTLPKTKSVPLFEWKKGGTGARRYLVEGENPGTGWTRAKTPLCLVWR